MAFLQLLLITTIIYTTTSQDCDDNTPGTLCEITGVNAGSSITCRTGDPCEITCSVSKPCTDGEIDASDATDVTITCDGTDTCKGNTDISCGTGDCILHCLNSATSCENTKIINPGQRAHSFQCFGECSYTTGHDSIYTQAPSTSPTQIVGTTTSQPSIVPTQYPTLSPSTNPSTFPSIIPSKSPSSVPTRSPTNNPSGFPSKLPTNMPSETPTISPLFAGETWSPSKNPSISPTLLITTKNPSKIPTNMPVLISTTNDIGDVEVVIDTTNDDGDYNDEKVKKETNNSSSWIYIVGVCSFICFCGGMIVIGRKMMKKRQRKETEYEDTYRKKTNNEMDFWTNPVHKEVTSMSGPSGVDGYNYETGTTTTVEMSDLNKIKTNHSEGDDIDGIDNMMTTNTAYDNNDDDIDDDDDDDDDGIVDDINMVTAGGDVDVDVDVDDGYDVYTDDEDDDAYEDEDEDHNDDDVNIDDLIIGDDPNHQTAGY